MTRTLFLKILGFFIDFQRGIENSNSINLSVTLTFTTDYRHESDTNLEKREQENQTSHR